MEPSSKITPAETTVTTGNTTLQECQKSTQFWFDDGTLVLHVENTLFRVHWGILKLHSHHFATLFDDKDVATESVIDFCPVMEMKDDQIADWVALLRRVYVASGNWTGSDMSFDEITSVARIAKKYHFEGLREDSARLFLAMSPRQPSIENHSAWLHAHGKHEVARFLNAAVELNFGGAAAMFYYLCVLNWTTNEILNGIDVYQVGDASSTRYRLGADVQRTALSGRDRMAAAMARFLKDQHWCSTAGCELSWDAMLDARLAFLSGIEHMKWAERKLFIVQGGGLCQVCRREGVDIARRAGEFWALVPGFFGLPRLLKELKKEDEGHNGLCAPTRRSSSFKAEII